MFFFSLDDLASFITMADTGLAKEVAENDYNGLIDVIGHLVAVKDRSPTTDNMFEPLKETIDLLRTYDQEVSDDVHTLLLELPERWTNLKKVAALAKQAVAPLQANEVAIIRKKCSSFDVCAG